MSWITTGNVWTSWTMVFKSDCVSSVAVWVEYFELIVSKSEITFNVMESPYTSLDLDFIPELEEVHIIRAVISLTVCPGDSNAL